MAFARHHKVHAAWWCVQLAGPASIINVCKVDLAVRHILTLAQQASLVRTGCAKVQVDLVVRHILILVQQASFVQTVFAKVQVVRAVHRILTLAHQASLVRTEFANLKVAVV
jgi:hypothetical protein